MARKKKKEPVAQIVALTASGENAKLAVSMAPLGEQRKNYAALLKSDDWVEREKRPLLELWSDSGEVLESNRPAKD